MDVHTRTSASRLLEPARAELSGGKAGRKTLFSQWEFPPACVSGIPAAAAFNGFARSPPVRPTGVFLSVETANGLITEPVESQHQQKVLLQLQMGAGGFYDGRDLAACDWPEGSASTLQVRIFTWKPFVAVVTKQQPIRGGQRWLRTRGPETGYRDLRYRGKWDRRWRGGGGAGS